MPNPILIFHCSACGIKLTVPADLAGIKGPCPSCHAEIQAPLETSPPAEAPIPTKVPAPVSTPIAAAKLAPSPEKPPSIPLQAPEPIPQKTQEFRSISAPEIPTEAASSSKSASLAWILYTIAALLILAGGWFVFSYFKEKTSPTPILTLPAPGSLSTATPTAPALPIPPTAATTAEPEPPTAPLEVLENFVHATTLAERLKLIETKTPSSELASSCLSAPFPATTGIRIDLREPNPAAQSIDFFYTVDFPNNRSQTLLVRKYNNGTTKLLADAFLDTFGGRLLEFTKSPIDGEKTFQAILTPSATCSGERVPNPANKLSLKLSAHENSAEIAQAHFEKSSKIGKMLEDGTYSLSYGKAKPCTVTLRWNSEEDAAQPFLEATEITAFTWNP